MLSIRPNEPWAHHSRSPLYAEFNPYNPMFGGVNQDQHQSDGPVIPVPWEHVSAIGAGSQTSNGSGSSQDFKIEYGSQFDPFLDPFRSKRRRRMFSLKSLKTCFGLLHKHKQPIDDSVVVRSSSPFEPPLQRLFGGPHHLPKTAWRDYGYWARPVIEGIEVCLSATAPPDHMPPDVNADKVIRSLHGLRGSPHPEKWIPGLQHPCLPPKPHFWKTPDPGEPNPLPWECRLNPFLEHPRVALPLIYFDMRLSEQWIQFETHNPFVLPLGNQNLNQPATYPFVTEMCITGVADDPHMVFPWPVAVYNARGILCKDVFHAIFQNFQEFLTKREVYGFSSFKKRFMVDAFHQRREEQLMGKVWDDQDGLRRIDYFADKVMFRGLEPSPNKDGSWVLFLGPPGPNEIPRNHLLKKQAPILVNYPPDHI